MSDADVAARRGALWVPRPDLGTLRVSGPDRLSWLQGVLTQDVAALAENEGSWSLLLTKQGKILADVTVLAEKDRVDLGIPSEVVERARETLERFLIMEDAELSDVPSEVAWASLHGPLACDVARTVAAECGGHFAAIDWTGLGGAALLLPRDALGAAEATAAAQPGVSLATHADWTKLRVERLVPLQSADFDDRQNPHEASLDRRSVSWTKGCYLGQEAVCMQDMRGKVKRRIAIVRLDAPGSLPAAGTPISDMAGTVVGETRTSAESEVLGGPVALALVAASVATVGTPLLVGGAPARVVEPR